jgi:hypothetical protein
VSHNFCLSKSNLSCHSYKFCCVLCEVCAEAEETAEYRACNTI